MFYWLLSIACKTLWGQTWSFLPSAPDLVHQDVWEKCFFSLIDIHTKLVHWILAALSGSEQRSGDLFKLTLTLVCSSLKWSHSLKSCCHEVKLLLVVMGHLSLGPVHHNLITVSLHPGQWWSETIDCCHCVTGVDVKTRTNRKSRSVSSSN